MRIEVKGHNLAVTDELRECVARRFERVDKQVSELAILTVELSEVPEASGATFVAEANLRLKGVTLRTHDGSRDIKHAINLAADEMSRQVKRHRDKRRKRREGRDPAVMPVPPLDEVPAPPGSLPAM
jgi:putative sigma-54 modulation protein